MWYAIYIRYIFTLLYGTMKPSMCAPEHVSVGVVLLTSIRGEYYSHPINYVVVEPQSMATK